VVPRLPACLHPTKARWIAANIAKLPELLGSKIDDT